MPPLPPRACFGRDELIKKIIDLAVSFAPIALIGPGGIGKTSIALTALHHDSIKEKFGENRRVIHCGQFPASRANFLNRLSKVIGAGVNNPEDLTPLRPCLSSKEMILLLDNAESILDPQGKNAKELSAVVEELSEIGNICLCLTSRSSDIPLAFESLDIPVLSIEASRNAFYHIYKNGGRPDLVDKILIQLDFHPLSVTLLAALAQRNKWDTGRLRSEWERQRTDLFHTQYKNNFATTVELSLASPTFRGLGPDAREILGVIAFFPQGVYEDGLDWLFPTPSDRASAFDSFCSLSLTYRCDGFITMLAPLRDYFRPKDPALSQPLLITKEYYFGRLSVDVDPNGPTFKETRWIISEDVNVEHLLDVFTSVDANSIDVWDACAYFMEHLRWHKKRLVVLGPKIEELSDNNDSKPQCLFQLSQLFASVGNYTECERLLTHALEIQRMRRDEFQTAEILRFISDANWWLGLYEEGIGQVEEALDIYDRLKHTRGQAYSWLQLARLRYGEGQLDDAEKAALRAINLLSNEEGLRSDERELLSHGTEPLTNKREKFSVCSSYHLLGDICRSKGRTEKATDHYQTALKMALSFGWDDQLFRSNYSLAELFFDQDRFREAHAYVENAKSQVANDPYQLGRAMSLQAGFWYKEGKFEEAKSEALGAISVYEEIGVEKELEACRSLLQDIEKEINRPATYYRWDL